VTRHSIRIAALSCLVALATSAWAEVPATAYSDLHWRLVGPHRGGWVISVAGVPGDLSLHYVGTADGGVWRTTDGGSNWEPISEGLGSSSIGALAVAPSDPSVLWAGTGQIQQRWDIVAGDGVYRSTDGGANWEHVGLTETRHIGDLWVDPRSADTTVVAALGHVFGPNAERGLFRTEDGGGTWSHVLSVDPDTGAADIDGDPALPDVLYASTWQVRRHPWLDYFQPTVGPGSWIYRSADGGRTWQPVAGEGLPERPLGRIEMAVARGTGARRVWAAIETADSGGLWRSEDGGATWAQVNDDATLAGSYMGWVTAHPSDPDTVWAGGQPLRRSVDGGATFTIVRSSPGGDDYHALWIDPTNPDHLLVGADQGAVVSVNDAATWSTWYNQPTGQFYRLAVDDEFPYRIYSGQQDSGTVGIASRSDYGRISFRDWSPVGADERDGDIPDPQDPDIVYGAGLGGRVSKWDRRTGQVQNVSPWPVGSYAARPGTTKYRYDWITPLAVSHHAPYALYAGAQVLFRSLDRGATWETVSPDLTGIDPDAGDCDGDVPVARATACGWGVIFAIAPSEATDGLVWVGTTNGRVQVTRDDGATWSDVTPPGLADWSKVNTIDPSPSDPLTAYVAADRHRADDAAPIVYRTHDGGATWTEIGHRLPAGEWVGAVRQDPEAPGLLYAGTQKGAYVSFDDGASWQSLQLDLPRTGINDLLVHEGDLIVATQGRALWVLDDLTPLRHLARVGAPAGVELAPPAAAVRLRFNQNRDTPLPPDTPTGENPPVGAVLDYWLPAGSSAFRLEIVDGTDAVVRSFASDEPDPVRSAQRVYFADTWRGVVPGPASGFGHHRFVWDLRLPAPPVVRGSYSIAATPGRPTPLTPEGAFVLPGTYAVRLVVGDQVSEQPLEVVMDPRVTTPRQDLAALLAFQTEVEAVLARAVALAGEEVEGAGRVAGRLASLAEDLESADAAPTGPQREVLRTLREELDGLGADR
jgi:photosystem II stability/assembly factor-like uncharacterized protein